MLITDMIDAPITMVTFDLYDTLVEAEPPGWIRFQSALNLSGFDVDIEQVMQAYVTGQRYFTVENGKVPIRDRSPEERHRFQHALTRVSLEALALPADAETVGIVSDNFRDDTKAGKILQYVAFDEVNGVLERLHNLGIIVGVVSNADSDVTQFCLHMGFAEHMDIIVTSALVGHEKPDRRTFEAALEPFNIAPGSALHVGDQPDSDVKGARAIGMAAALLDRYEQFTGHDFDAVIVRSLSEMVDLIEVHNAIYG